MCDRDEGGLRAARQEPRARMYTDVPNQLCNDLHRATTELS